MSSLGVVPTTAVAEASETAQRGRLEFVRQIPVDAGTSVGGRLVGDYFYVTSWRHISIYDVSEPLDPQLMSKVAIGTGVSNEDVATNGEILLYSHQGWQSEGADNALYVWDVSNKRVPVLRGLLPGAGEHTMSCILDCKWAYGADGKIIDLRDPVAPQIAGRWHDRARFDNHDVEEVKPGFIVSTPTEDPMELIDVRRPLRPKVVGEGVRPLGEWWFHQAHWPRAATDRFLLMGSEGPFSGLTVYEARGWRKGRRPRLMGMFATSGSGSAHWFTTHPDFDNGGLVAMSFFDEGTKVLHVDPRGGITEVDSLALSQSNAWASHWIDDEIIYTVDWTRGIDILRWVPES